MSKPLRVPVRGGELGGYVWPAVRDDAPVVVAAHGITANSMSWAAVAEQLAGTVTLVAPDLRGRADSRTLGGPYGVAAHAADLVAVLDELGVASAVALGHSMGAYVAAVAAAGHPERFDAALLVDGGVAFATPAPEDVDETLQAVLGPAMARLEMSFHDLGEYREYWRAHPAFAGAWSRWVEDYISHDLVGEPPRTQSSCVAEAVRADGADILTDSGTHAAVHALRPPSRLLWAPRGLLDEPTGLYNEARLAEAGLPVSTIRVSDTNHYTVTLGEPGAATIAAHVREITQT